MRSSSGEILDEPDQLVAPVALLAGEANELARARDHGALLRRARDGDAAPAPELEQALVAQETKRAEHRVRVHLEDGREVAGRRKALARLRLAVGDGAPDLGRDLLEELGRFLSIDLDTKHCAIHTSTTMIAPPRPPSHDEIEALIKEARERQLRRRLLGAAGLALASALGLAVYAIATSGSEGPVGEGSTGVRALPICRSSQLSAKVGLSGATGTMDGGAMLTNKSAAACSLPLAPPRVGIFWRGKRMPAREQRMSGAGTKFVHVLAPGKRAWVPMDWANWCGRPSEGTLITPTLVLRFGGLRIAAKAHVMTPPRCGSPGGSTISVGPPVKTY